MNIIKKILLVTVSLLFFACSNTKKKKKIVNLDTLPSNEGWFDIPLSIVNEKYKNDYVIYTAKALYKNDTLGITIKLKKNIPAGFVNGVPKNMFLTNGVEFISNGIESNKLIQFMASKYGVKALGLKLKKQQIFTCANLNQTKPNYKNGKSRFKIFLENEKESAELFVNFDFSKKIISFNEKDIEYRKPLIHLLKE